MMLLASLAVLAALAATALAERRYRRQAQAMLARRIRFDRLIAGVSAAFTNLPDWRVDEECCAALSRTALVTGAQRCVLTVYAPDARESRTWTSTGGPSVSTADLAERPYCLAQFCAGREIRFRSTADLPAEAAIDRATFEQQRVSSMLAVPFSNRGGAIATIAVQNMQETQPWPEDLHVHLRLLGEILFGAIALRDAGLDTETRGVLNHALLRSFPEYVIVIDRTGKILDTNRQGLALNSHAFAPVPRGEPGENYFDTWPDTLSAAAEGAKGLKLVRQVASGSLPRATVYFPCDQSGGERRMEIHALRLDGPRGGALIVHLDLAARKNLNAPAGRPPTELPQLDRGGVLSEFASALSHELRQPLAAILANSEAATTLLQQDPPDHAEALDALSDIRKSVQMADGVIDSMRSMLKRAPSDTREVDLNELILETTRLVRRESESRRVRLDLELSPSQPALIADEVQLQQVILNLTKNAIEAVSAQPDSRRKVTLRTGSLSDPPRVLLEVEDSGPGVPERHRQTIFNPFFSTKPDGLGIGLSITRSIVESHGGRIWTEAPISGGTRFRCVFPANSLFGLASGNTPAVG